MATTGDHQRKLNAGIREKLQTTNERFVHPRSWGCGIFGQIGLVWVLQKHKNWAMQPCACCWDMNFGARGCTKGISPWWTGSQESLLLSVAVRGWRTIEEGQGTTEGTRTEKRNVWWQITGPERTVLARGPQRSWIRARFSKHCEVWSFRSFAESCGGARSSWSRK